LACKINKKKLSNVLNDEKILNKAVIRAKLTKETKSKLWFRTKLTKEMKSKLWFRTKLTKEMKSKL